MCDCQVVSLLIFAVQILSKLSWPPRSRPGWNECAHKSMLDTKDRFLLAEVQGSFTGPQPLAYALITRNNPTTRIFWKSMLWLKYFSASTTTCCGGHGVDLALIGNAIGRTWYPVLGDLRVWVISSHFSFIATFCVSKHSKQKRSMHISSSHV